MPGRKIPLVVNEIYHVYNRGVASQPILLNKRDYNRMVETIFYYQNKNFPIKYSKFLTLPRSLKEDILKDLERQRKFIVEVIAYCLMPNHLHLLLRQTAGKGISKFMANVTNSYARYFNTKKERMGPLFQGRFKTVRVETDEQLFHLTRYTHLNPYTSYIVRSLQALLDYPYSSFPEYIGRSKTNYCAKEIILANFKNPEGYKEFVFDQADYQRTLEGIKHLKLES